ncbi:hypothetical protein SLEP1_g59007 [Rubroshorea leprosula]|uniref:Transposase (putative) gypsy type domain-containing protein n=1 Tax=Rubroshorea leprosula TaxID=152421 RepID=A0AAV5MSA0_9ROSI|nr:hypothetical protein SLEP1_g59007 [Rubroshorea leprosula]
MVSLRELTEQRGNQGREGEEEGILSVEPITMIVPPELQDLPETMASEGSTSSSTGDDGGDLTIASSSSSSIEETPSREEGMGDVVSSVSDRLVVGEWEGVTIPGRLSNLRKAPKDLPAGFRFKAALHHEVADCAPSISGYKRLEEMVRAYHIPKTILLRTGGQNEKACTVSQTGWIPVYADHFDADLRFPLPGLIFDLLADYELALTQLMPNSIRFIIGFMLLCARLEVPAKAIMFRSLFQCRLCPNSRGAKWYYLSGRDKSQLFKNVRNKVARWKRQFIFVRYTRAERISNDLAARLSEWRTPNAHINYPQLLPWDVDLKNQLLEYAQREGLIDLEALVTSEHLVVFGFVDVTNLFSEGMFLSYSTSSSRAESYAFFCVGDMSSILECQRQRAQGSRGRASGSAQPRQTRFDERPPRRLNHAARHTGDPARRQGRADHRLRLRRLLAMVQAMHGFVPPADSKRAKAFVQQHGGQVAMIKLMDAFSYAVALYESEHGAHTKNSELGSKCKQLAAEKASLVDDVNRLQGAEMANRAAIAESRADELAHRINELKEELERVRAQKESGIQASKDEVARVEERAKRAEGERDRAQTELGSLKFQITEADKNLSATEEALNDLKASHARSVVAVASANVTTEIYNEIRGKVLHHRPDFPIRELVFFDEEELDEHGRARLAASVLEDGEDPVGLPSFDAWVESAPVAEQEPSSTPPSSQPARVPVSSPVNAPAPEPAARSPVARSPLPAADASMPVDLTDD